MFSSLLSSCTGERETVYNFEVEGTHTSLVGETGVLVHNACWIEKVAAHTLHRGGGRTVAQWSNYLARIAEGAGTTTRNGATIWQRVTRSRGVEILIRRPNDLVNGGTYYLRANREDAAQHVAEFILENGGVVW